MANGNKKSSRPDLLGIHRRMLEAGQDTRAASFVGGAMQAFKLNVLEEEKAKATLEQHMENLGGVVNINKLSEEQRGPVTEFLKQGRDDYYALATEYAKTKDPATKDKMDAIKYSFQTLNSQLAQYATGKAEYLSDYEDGNLIGGEGFAAENSFYTKIYGDPNAQFTIDQTTSEMSFTANGVTKNLKDMDGHTIRFYEGETAIDKYVQMGKEAKMTGANWMGAETTAKNFVNAFRGTNRNDIKALMYTDLSGDESNLSFIEQFRSGTLKDRSFYNGIKMNEDGTVAEEDISRILNSKKLSLDLLGKFVGNVSDMSYNNAAVNPDVAINLEYRRLQSETMRVAIDKKKNPTSPSVSVFKDYEYISWYGENKLTGPEASKLRQDIADRKDILNRYTWKDDHWYDTQEEKKIGGNDDLAKEMNIMDPRFYDIASAAGGQPTEINFVKKPFTLPELAKEGVDRTLFQGDARDAVAKLKPLLPDNYDIVTGDDWSWSGKRGKGSMALGKELFTGDNYFEIVNTETGDVVGKFGTQYVKDPAGAQAVLVDFQKQMKDILGFKPKPSL